MTNAANALKEWQDKRPEAYQSSYQDRINEVLDRSGHGTFCLQLYAQDPLYRQYAQQYTQNAHNASADAAAQAAALTGGYGSSYAASAAQQAYQQQIGALSEAIPTCTVWHWTPTPAAAMSWYRGWTSWTPRNRVRRSGTTGSSQITTPSCSRKARITTTPTRRITGSIRTI